MYYIHYKGNANKTQIKLFDILAIIHIKFFIYLQPQKAIQNIYFSVIILLKNMLSHSIQSYMVYICMYYNSTKYIFLIGLIFHYFKNS